jgi:hypothetical protein
MLLYSQVAAYMPDNQTHSNQSRRKYGKSYSTLHHWMDRPSAALHEKHRIARHDFNKTPYQAQKVFGGNAKNACRDHTRLDKRVSRQKRAHRHH